MSLASIFFSSGLASSLWTSNSRSSGTPLALLRTLVSAHALHYTPHRKRPSCCSWNSSNKRTFICESLKSSDITPTATVPSSFKGYSEYGRLLPCPSENGPPRIEHIVVSEGGPVLEYISEALDLPPPFVADLIHFGAVYYALVCPEPPPSATPEQVRVYREVTASSVLKRRASIRGKTVREAQKTFRITHVDEFVEAGTYLRVHVHPKRFPRCYEIDWKSRIIAVSESYVVLDKPAGTSEKKVKKLYLALAAAPLPIGIVTHYMRPINMAPRLISEDPIKGWHLCQLQVLECERVPWPDTVTEEKYCVDDCGWPSKDYAFECKINLLTGRTHQIRAQLAACGAPVVGDSMYMPAAIAELANPGLNLFGKYKKQFTSEDDKTAAVQEWIAQHGKEPSIAIGLQACQISWDEGMHIYHAGSPWWR
ncbi:RNA pseudouridine synthase 6, chloroplastic isoform X2 [Malania oleifera]|uniref:RNA pseudouridine synthase 6, chloroplastic isoform X2 n=1 Tax=Malania oleifera TaxID=397392 RepID=UPI0025AE4925|nr:RNA pseudouridine synthase 6, chloroplastic isoform X2 [Malania oleifera]